LDDAEGRGKTASGQLSEGVKKEKRVAVAVAGRVNKNAAQQRGEAPEARTQGEAKRSPVNERNTRRDAIYRVLMNN